jgi:insulysin
MSFDQSPTHSEDSPLLEETDDDHVVFMGEEPEASRFISPTKSKRGSTRGRPVEWSAIDRFWTWLCASAGVFVLVLLLIVMKRNIASNSSLAANVGGGELSLHKSPNDARSYEYTVLDNGLQVLLVSDPVATKGAAAMDVGVGHFSDPEDVAGLAHLTEHMLFLGTKKYPDENGFDTLLGENGGDSNAFTDSENTNYYFSIKADRMEKALDHFSGFFESPLLLKESIANEKKAVISEHSKNIDSDSWRITEVLRSTSNAKYPYHKFGTGNAESLKDRCRPRTKEMIADDANDDDTNGSEAGTSSPTPSAATLTAATTQDVSTLLLDIPNKPAKPAADPLTPPPHPFSPSPSNQVSCSDLHESLVRFHHKYYSSNLMRLTIVSSQSIEQLSKWANTYFSNIPNRHRPSPAAAFNYAQFPVRIPSQLGVRYNIVPVSDLRQLQLSWFMPSQKKFYKKKVSEYLSNVLGDESQGSLRSILYNEGLINGLMAGTTEQTTDFEMFTITVDLTLEGLDHVKRIVTKIYDYLKMLRELGPQKWFWDEQAALAEVDLRFQDKTDSASMVSQLASDLQQYDPEDVLVGSFQWETWDSEVCLFFTSIIFLSFFCC